MILNSSLTGFLKNVCDYFMSNIAFKLLQWNELLWQKSVGIEWWCMIGSIHKHKFRFKIPKISSLFTWPAKFSKSSALSSCNRLILSCVCRINFLCRSHKKCCKTNYLGTRNLNWNPLKTLHKQVNFDCWSFLHEEIFFFLHSKIHDK